MTPFIFQTVYELTRIGNPRHYFYRNIRSRNIVGIYAGKT